MMKKLAKSPDRGSFIKQSHIKRLLDEGSPVSTDSYLEFLLSFEQQKIEREQDPAWQQNNLEYDLRSSDLIVEKARARESYAQNLYAALCNNEFVQLTDTWNILKEKYWSCSWRYSGGIIADILETGDYIDWYCSGIDGDGDYGSRPDGYVSEGIVTAEIKEDLKTLGWVVIVNENDI